MTLLDEPGVSGCGPVRLVGAEHSSVRFAQAASPFERRGVVRIAQTTFPSSVGGFTSRPASTVGAGASGSADAIGSSFLGWRPHVATSCHGKLGRDWVDGSDWIVFSLVGGLTSRPAARGGLGRDWIDGSDWIAVSRLVAPRRDQLPLGRGRDSVNGQWLSLGWRLHIATSCHGGRGLDWVGGCDWIVLSGLAVPRRDQLPRGAPARVGRRERLGRSC